MKKIFALLMVAGLAASAFAQNVANPGKAKFYGEKFEIATPLAFDEVLSALKKSDEVSNIQISGQVSEVCQKKGCWLKLEQAGVDDVHVTFKDYGFFVPKDLAGKTVVLLGKAWINFTDVEELQHYAYDAGKSKEEIAAIKEPKREPRFEATGVAVY